MVGALGVNQRWLFTGACSRSARSLAGLGGALQIPREPANLDIDLGVISDAFVVVVVGGLGSHPGRLPRGAADRRDQGVLHRARSVRGHAGHRVRPRWRWSLVRAALGILLGRPQGRAGARAIRAQARSRVEPPFGRRRARSPAAVAGVAVLARCRSSATGYALVLRIDILVFALFAVSLHFLMGPGGMVSFGHAAYFGLGAYGAGPAAERRRLPMELALVAAPVVAGLGARAVRLVLRAAVGRLSRRC